MYTADPRVYDALTGRLEAAYSYPWGLREPALPHPEEPRVYVLGGDGAYVLHAFDKHNSRWLGATGKITQAGSGISLGQLPRRLVACGAGCVAFIGGAGKVCIVRTSEVQAAPAVPPLTAENLPGGVRRLNLPVMDAVYDTRRGRLYASVRGGAGEISESVAVIDPRRGEVLETLHIGIAPRQLRLSKDGRYLWVADVEAMSVQQFDLETRAVTKAIDLIERYQPSADGVQRVRWHKGQQFVVPPDTDTFIAVVSADAAALFDETGMRPAKMRHLAVTAYGMVEFGATSSMLYANNFQSLLEIKAGASGLTTAAETPGLFTAPHHRFLYHEGVLYSSSGDIVDPVKRERIGRLDAAIGFQHVAIDEDSRRLLLSGLDGSYISAYDAATRERVGYLPREAGQAISAVKKLLGCGGGSACILTDDREKGPALYLIHASLFVSAP